MQPFLSAPSWATVYYLPGTMGWGSTFGGRPTALWDPSSQFGYATNGNAITIKGYCGAGGAVTVPDTLHGMPVTSIGTNAFRSCYGLTAVTIPASVTNIGAYAFYQCTSLSNVFCCGNAPTVGSSAFALANNATVYYLAGTTGWGATYGGRPTRLWNPQVQSIDATFGVRTNRFGFTITGTSNLVIVVEACTNLADAAWSPLGTNTLTGGSSYFSDPQWTNYPSRFYRLRSP